MCVGEGWDKEPLIRPLMFQPQPCLAAQDRGGQSLYSLTLFHPPQPPVRRAGVFRNFSGRGGSHGTE